MKNLLVPIITILALSQNAFAATGLTASVYIESVAIVATAYGGHIAGNMEVKVKNGFQLPSGVYCDTAYITTKKTIDPDRAMFSLLREAVVLQRPVRMHITDNSTYTAYQGRCSLLGVILSY